MLDGLSLTLRGAFGDGAADEDDELLDAGPLEEAEMAGVGGVGQYDRVGSFRAALEDQQRRDLHRFPIEREREI